MTHRRNIICFSSIDWEFNWQGHQEVMAAFAAQGNRVLFIENTGVRSPRFSDLPRLKRRLQNWWTSTRGFRQERPNLYVYSPVVLPFPHSRIAQWVNRVTLASALRQWSRAAHFGRPIIWTFLPTQLIVDLIDRLDPELTVYYCIADFDQLTSNPRALARSERRLLDRADLVFVQGEELRRRSMPHPNVHVFPFGVNTRVFQRDVEVAPELSGLKRPIIGYVGGLHRHVDMALLERVAKTIDGTVVAVGPLQEPPNGLDRLSNLVFAGAQPHARIPEFVKGFDVGIVPYALSDYTRTVYPTKMNEYLAMGVPVVTTDLPEVRKFADANGGIVDVTSTPEAFVSAITRAVATRSSADDERRVAVAGQSSWTHRIAEMTALMDAALERRQQTEERWDVALGRLYRRTRRRTIPLAVGLVAAYVLLFHTPMLWLLAEPLRVAGAAQPADAIVVFGGGVGESGRVESGAYEERVEAAVGLYQQGRADQMLFLSGYTYLFEETDVMRALAVAKGVAPSNILVENGAGTTREYVVVASEIAMRQGWRRVLLVTSPYHTRRATMTWRKLAPQVEVVVAPETSSRFYSHDVGATPEQFRGILQEFVTLVYYRLRGWS